MSLLKALKPKSLFGRLFLMLLISSLIIDSIGIYLIINRSSMLYTKKVLISITSVVYLIQNLQKLHTNQKKIQSLIKNNFNFTLITIPYSQFQNSKKKYKKKNFNPLLNSYIQKYLIQRLRKNIVIQTDSNTLVIYMLSPLRRYKEVMVLYIPTSYLFTNTVYLVIAWLVFAPLILGIIVLIMIRNQLKPLRKLTQKLLFIKQHGIEPTNLRVRGAYEVRLTISTFNEMTQSLSIKNKENSNLLKSVGNSIIEPLTIMRTKLELQTQNSQVIQIKNIIDKTQKNIGKLLNLASLNLKNEPKEHIILEEYLSTILSQWVGSNMTIFLQPLAPKKNFKIHVAPIQFQFTLFQTFSFLSYTSNHLNLHLEELSNHGLVLVMTTHSIGHHKEEGLLKDSVDYKLLKSTFQLLNITIHIQQTENQNILKIYLNNLV